MLNFQLMKSFYPFIWGMISEANLFNTLEVLPKANWQRVIHDLQYFAVPNLQDKNRLMELVRQNTESRLKLETEHSYMQRSSIKKKIN